MGHTFLIIPPLNETFTLILCEGFFVTSKSNIDAQLRGFWFAPNGNDDFSGETLEVPKLTIQSAIDAAAALVPPPSFNFSGFVTAAQGGEFFDPFVMVESVSLDGNNCNLIVDAPIAVTMASSGLFNMTAISNSQASGICVKVEDNTIRGIDLLFMGVSGDSGIGMEISGTISDLFSSTRLVTLSGESSIGYDITSTNSTPIDIEVEVAGLMANDTTFIKYNPVSGTCSASVSTISSDGFTGTMVADVRSGILTLNVDIANSDMFAEVSDGAQFGVKANAITGDTIARDTAVVNYKSIGFYNGNISVEDTATMLADINFLISTVEVQVGATLTLNVGTYIGDINVDGTAFLIIQNHIGSITGSGTINGLINGVPFGTYRQKHQEQVVLNGFDTNNQVPVGTDNPLQVTFGAAQFGSSDPVELSAAGAITINQSDQYNMLVVFQYGRTGAAGGSTILFFRVLINGVQFGRSLYADLDNPNQAFPVEFVTPINLLATDVLTVEIWRDSAGFDAGQLIPKVPTLGGTNSSPSAAITLTRNRNVQPEIAP